MYMSAGVLRALTLLVTLPSTVDILRSFKWSHLSASVLQVASATFLGAITRTLFISNLSYFKVFIAVKVMAVFPKPNPCPKTDPKLCCLTRGQCNIVDKGVVRTS